LHQRALAADVQHGAFRAERRGDAGHRVGAARAGGRHDTAKLARLPRIAIRRVRRDLLMTHIDDADTFVDAAVVDVDNVPAAQRENGVDAFALQHLGDKVAA
jgi:hypothetical protein